MESLIPIQQRYIDIFTFDNLLRRQKDWDFLVVYGHCCDIYANDPTWGKHFPVACRDFHSKPSFYYLKLGGNCIYSVLSGDDNDCIGCLRGVSQLDLSSHYVSLDGDDLDSIDSKLFENIRGAALQKFSLRISTNNSLTVDHFNCFRGIQELTLFHCDLSSLPNVAFECLRGIHTLKVDGCTFPYQSSVYNNLRGIQHLEIVDCANFCPSDQDAQYLRGIKVLSIDDDFSLTESILRNFRGIESLDISACGSDLFSPLTDSAFRNFRGIKTLMLSQEEDYSEVTDEAFKNLRGVKYLTLGDFPRITENMFTNLRGIEHLTIGSCPQLNLPAEALRNMRGIKSLSWGENYDYDILLDEEWLFELQGAERLDLNGVLTVSDEPFRHLSRIQYLYLSGHPGEEEEHEPLSDVAFSYLKNVKRIQFTCMELSKVSNFYKLVTTCMPKLERIHVFSCRVAKRALHVDGNEKGYQYATFNMYKENGQWTMNLEK